MGAIKRLQIYLELSKGGIVTLVMINVVGGYLVGQPAGQALDPVRLVLTLAGTFLLASGSSALNQIMEAGIDARMPRTAGRPLPSGRLSRSEALAVSAFSVASGLYFLSRVSAPVAGLGLAALALYNLFYTLWWKPRWAFAAVPGAIPGALPILMGYCAASGDVAAPGGIFLFLLVVFWQMPHFWVLALRYCEDYRAGGVPTLPVARGEHATIVHIVGWTLGYAGLAILGPVFLGAGPFYLVVAALSAAAVLVELRSFVLARPEGGGAGPRWLRFFMCVNLSLVALIVAAAVDRWIAVLA